jgi:hypothetical protein
MIYLEGEHKVIATTTTLTQDLSIQHKQVNKIVEEHEDISYSPMGVPLHYQIPHSIDLLPNSTLHNDPIYRPSFIENESFPHVQHISIDHDSF